MKFPGFCGGSYSGRSSTPAGDRTQNLYQESTRGGSPESPCVLLSTPGQRLFSTLPTSPLQAIYSEPSTGRLFAVAGATLYEILANGASSSFGAVDAGPYTFASNGAQVMISCAGTTSAYVFTLTTNALAKVSAAGFMGTSGCTMIDNYFISLVPSSRKFQISSLLDGTAWDGLDFALAEGGAENLVGMICDHRELWLFGSRHAEIYVDTGAANFPFERINSTFVEQGLASARALVQLDNTIYWLGINQHGQARVFRNDNYTPVGVSNRAVEWFFNEYAKNGGISDAVMYGYQDESGHTFLVISFPSVTCEPSATGGMVNGVIQGATWVYDLGENAWHERSRLVAGVNAMHSTVHAFGFGKQLVGGADGTGNVYELSTDVYQDNGTPIKRVRRTPHVVDELKWISYNKLRLSAEVGNGPVGDANNQVVLRVSNDGGRTWSNEYSKPLGDTGNYTQVVEWRRLGRSMRRSFEVSTTINAPVCWVDADLEIVEGLR